MRPPPNQLGGSRRLCLLTLITLPEGGKPVCLFQVIKIVCVLGVHTPIDRILPLSGVEFLKVWFCTVQISF